MNACSLSFGSSAAVKTRTDGSVARTRSTPSGAAMRHSAVIGARAARPQHLARGGQRTAGREHRVDDVRVPAGEIVGEPFEVGERPVRRLVPLEADDADLGVGQRGEHAVEQPEARRGGSGRRAGPGIDGPHARARRGPSGVVTSSGFGRQVARRLVGEEARDLACDAPEVDGLRAFVAQREHAVGDERMVNDGQRHRLRTI